MISLNCFPVHYQLYSILLKPFLRKLSRLFFRSILVALIFCSCCSIETKAQEEGKLLMKQELGYTLGGGVAGVGIGVVVWFMDPLNPNATIRNAIKDGFIIGTSLGALFGFYMLNNAIVFPEEQIPVQDFDELLSLADDEDRRYFSKRRKKRGRSWTLPVLDIRF
mgnify:FL=1